MHDGTDAAALVEAQERLGKALERARAGEDRELAAQVRELGQQLARLLFGLLRMTRVHASDNEAFDKPLHDLQAVIAALVELLGVVHCVTVEDQVYVNDVRIRFQDRVEGGGELGAELRRLGVGGLSFHQPPAVEHLRRLVRAFARPPVGVLDRTALVALLQSIGAQDIEVAGPFRFRVAGDGEEPVEAQDPRRVARRATAVVDETWDAMTGARVPNPLPMRRAVAEILHMGPGLEGLWEDARGGSSFGGHCLRVCRLSLVLAQAVGLPEESVQDLGLAAMFHDIGYAAREGARPATGERAAEPGFAPPFERHGTAGARLLLRQRGFHEAKVRRALACLEHHREYDDPRGRPSLFARILRIAEDYDNLLRHGGSALTPSRVLARMAGGAGSRYDPILMQAFVNAMGRWPPGSRLLLADGAIVRSISTARTPETWATPLARVEVDGAGRTWAHFHPRLDLAQGPAVVEEVAGEGPPAPQPRPLRA